MPNEWLQEHRAGSCTREANLEARERRNCLKRGEREREENTGLSPGKHRPCNIYKWGGRAGGEATVGQEERQEPAMSAECCQKQGEGQPAVTSVPKKSSETTVTAGGQHRDPWGPHREQAWAHLLGTVTP